MARLHSLWAGSVALFMVGCSSASAQTLEQLLKGADHSLSQLLRGKQSPAAPPPSSPANANPAPQRHTGVSQPPPRPPLQPPKAPPPPRPPKAAEPKAPSHTPAPSNQGLNSDIKRNAAPGATGCTYARTKPGGASQGGSTSACNY